MNQPGAVTTNMKTLGTEPETVDLALSNRARTRDLVLHPASDYANCPQPMPVLWRDSEDAKHDAEPKDAVLSVGEISILASAGGTGKSTLTLELASAAVKAGVTGRPYGAACGLRVSPGPVALVSFEDAPPRIAHRLKWQNVGRVPSDVLLWPDPSPLWMASADRSERTKESADWPRLWDAIRIADVRLVIIDPVSAALADVSTSETSPVRAFLRALTREAAPNKDAGWTGCGVLLVAHDTKAARNALARGEDPGAGVVAGSAAWYDGVRGVLTLAHHPDQRGNDRLLECVKANYGRTGWGVRLRERTDTKGNFRGFELGTRLKTQDAVAAAKQSPVQKGNQATQNSKPATRPHVGRHGAVAPGEVAE